MRSSRTLKAVHPHVSNTGLCYLSWPAADSHTSKRERKAFVHADGWSWNVKDVHCATEQCSCSRSTCKYTSAFAFKFRFPGTLGYTKIPPSLNHIPSSSHKLLHTHTHTPSPIYPQPCVIYTTVAHRLITSFHTYVVVICGIQWVFKITGIHEHLQRYTH